MVFGQQDGVQVGNKMEFSCVPAVWTTWCWVVHGLEVAQVVAVPRCQPPTRVGAGVRSTEERLHGKGPFSWTQGMGRSQWRRHAQRGSVA